MFGARASVALALACALLPAFPRAVAADAPVPLDYKAYDGWNAVRTPRVSDDGRHLAYALTPEDGDPPLVVRDLDSGAERREPRGNAPAFAGDGRFVVYTHVALKKDVDAAKKAKKAEKDQPKNGLGILDLNSTAPAEVIDDVKTIAVRAEPSPAPSGSPAAAPDSPSPVASAKPSMPPKGEPAPQIATAASPGPSAASPAPSPSASPAPKADKTKDPGSALTIRDLAGTKRVTARDATEFAVSDDDRFVAYATETKNGKGDGLHVYDVARGATTDVMSGEGRYRDIAIARDVVD